MTITYVQQTCKEEDLATIKKVNTQEKKSQPLTKKYTPPQLRSRDNLKDEQLLPRVTGSRKLEPKRLQLTGTIKNKDITILVDSGSTHNVIDINKEKKLNIFMFPAKGIKVSTIVDQNIEEVRKCHKVAVQIQILNLHLDYYALPLKEVDLILGAN